MKLYGSKLAAVTVAATALALPAAALRPAELAGAAAPAPPTFATDVAPIIYNHCAVCHRPGQAAPFSLLSYEDVKKKGALVVTVTKRAYMPPWHATQAPGFAEFRDARRLSEADIATLKTWYDAGMPAGNLKNAPRLPVFPSGWALGRPDVEVTLPRAIDVPADGPDLHRNVVLSVDLQDDAWVTAIDFEPSARSVVHHALFFAGPAADMAATGENDVLPGLGAGPLGALLGGGAAARARGRGVTGVGGWVPGMTPRFFPEGVALPFPAHSNIAAQLHLHPSGKPEREQGRLAVYFAKKPPRKSLVALQVPPVFGLASGIDIPAGEKHFAIKGSFVLPTDIEAFGARGHAHYLARDMRMTATLPDGSSRGLLWISDWDFGWQDSYFYKTPFTLPKGTRIDAEIAYDNTAENPRNPSSPPKRVRWGRGSLDEMGSMSLLVAAASPAEDAELRESQAQYARQQLLTWFLRRR